MRTSVSLHDRTFNVMQRTLVQMQSASNNSLQIFKIKNNLQKLLIIADNGDCSRFVQRFLKYFDTKTTTIKQLFLTS